MSISELYALYKLYKIGFLTNEEAISILISYMGFCLVALFATRTVLILFSRKIGIYHPDYYRFWPRLPWRSLMAIWNDIRIWFERAFQMGKRATGGFASALQTLTLLYKPGHILLGRAFAWGFGLLQPVGINVERHLFMYAMTGAGKTTALITILSTWRNSVFVIDPKAQITNALFEHDWRTWSVIDPYGISNAISACFNAFDCIKSAMEREGPHAAVLWAMRIAQAIVITPVGARTPYFYDTARGFIFGVILHVLSTHPDDDHDLPYIRNLLINGYRVYSKETGKEETTPEEAQQLLIRAMLNNPAFDGAIAGAAAALANASGETGGNIRSTLLEQTKWLDIPAVRDVLRSTSLPLSDLKTRKDVVFSLTAPVLSIREELAPLCRLLTNMTAYTFEYVRGKNGQCLTIVDELPSQGYNETFEVMLAVARSYGQTVLGISQNIELMKKTYPKSWATFSGEADAVFWMATNHDDTATHLSQILGKKSHVEKDNYSGRKTYREVAVMDADQVKRFLSPDSGNLIVTRAGMRALKLKNEPYFKALPIWKYAADPDHKEVLGRRIARKIFGRKARIHSHPAPSKSTESISHIPLGTEEIPANAQVFTSENIIRFPNNKSPKNRR